MKAGRPGREVGNWSVRRCGKLGFGWGSAGGGRMEGLGIGWGGIVWNLTVPETGPRISL